MSLNIDVLSILLSVAVCLFAAIFLFTLRRRSFIKHHLRIALSGDDRSSNEFREKVLKVCETHNANLVNMPDGSFQIRNLNQGLIDGLGKLERVPGLDVEISLEID